MQIVWMIMGDETRRMPDLHVREGGRFAVGVPAGGGGFASLRSLTQRGKGDIDSLPSPSQRVGSGLDPVHPSG